MFKVLNSFENKKEEFGYIEAKIYEEEFNDKKQYMLSVKTFEKINNIYNKPKYYGKIFYNLKETKESFKRILDIIEKDFKFEDILKILNY